MNAPESPRRQSPNLPRVGAIVAVALGVALLAYLLLKDDDSDSGGSADAEAFTVEELQDLAASQDRPVFWAGPRRDTKLEVTETDEGSVYVRYLPEDTEVGDPNPGFLTIATYALDNGYARVVAAGQEQGARPTKLQNGGLTVVNPKRPSSVYLAYPRGKYQVEVYDPSPQRARSLVLSGAVQPVQ